MPRAKRRDSQPPPGGEDDSSKHGKEVPVEPTFSKASRGFSPLSPDTLASKGGQDEPWWDGRAHATQVDDVKAWQRAGWIVWPETQKSSSSHRAAQAPTDTEASHCKDKGRPPLFTALPAAGSVASSTRIGSDCCGAVGTISSYERTSSGGSSSSLQFVPPVQLVTPFSHKTLPADPCYHWQKGFCSWGSRCRFAHIGGPSNAVDSPHNVAGAHGLSSTATCAATDVTAGGVSADVAGLSLAAEDNPKCTHEGAGQFVKEKEGSEVAEDDVECRWVWRRPAARLWAHIYLHKWHHDFDLVPMLIGRGGGTTKGIFRATNAKLRIRGRGSGHLEVDGRKGGSCSTHGGSDLRQDRWSGLPKGNRDDTHETPGGGTSVLFVL